MSDPRKFKNDIIVEGDISLPSETASRALVIDATGDIASSAVTVTELSLLSGATVNVSDLEQDIEDLVTLSGVAANSVDLGTFTGATIPDSSDVKEALQALETSLEEVDVNVNDLISLSGVAENATDLGTFTGAIIPDNSDIKEALQALETEIEGIPSPFYYAGTWAASTNTPTLDNTDTGVQGAVYYVTNSGSVDFGAGSISFDAGDKVANNGTTWDKWDMTDSVASVNSQTGAVVLEADDIDVAAGYAAASGTVAAADTIQEALQKLDGNIADHIGDTTGAHAASAIAVTPAGNLAADDVQEGLEELQGDIDDLVALSGVASGSTDLGTFTGVTIPDNSDIKEALQALETEVESLPSASPGDIAETSFSAANNVAAPANVTGFAFANATVRSFSALVSVSLDATTDLFEEFHLQGIQKAASWSMSVDGVGDNSGITFSITTAGQVQYTSGNAAGFVSNTIRFRAITTSV